MTIIKRLPIHPPPVYEKSIGEWIESLAEANLTPFKVMVLYISKIAKDIGFISTLKKITGVPSYILAEDLENQFKPRYWDRKRVCIIKGCKFMRRNDAKLFEHLKNVHHLGDGWYLCRICDFKSKSIQDLQDHLSQNHTSIEIRKYLNFYPSQSLLSMEIKGHLSFSTGEIARIRH